MKPLTPSGFSLTPQHACLAMMLATGIACGGLNSLAAEIIHVDCSQEQGTIRPLHGVNGGALVQGETTDLRESWRELGVPITRLHDCEWPLPDVVDVHAVFPHPDADPQDPNSYRFSLTDSYVQAIIDTQASIVYRLGESIEHSHHRQYVHPPTDAAHWAAACLGIVRHYNDDWAAGFHHNIRYWEIWNEPENRPAMWSGNDHDYYQLYVTAAKAIKSRYPELSVGGPSVGATGEFDGDTWQPTAFLQGFIRYVAEHQAPLDFFSWHTYTNDPAIYLRKARAIRQWLDEAGFTHTRVHLNEWNYLPDNDWSLMLQQGSPERRQEWFDRVGSAEGAAFLACVLSYLQDSPVDVANYYSGDTNAFGLFSHAGAPRTTYYAMKAFRQLLDTPQRVQTTGWRAGSTAACAGINQQRDRVSILLSNFRCDDPEFHLQVDQLPWSGSTTWRLLQVDAQHNLQQVASGVAAAPQLTLPCRAAAPSLLLVQLQPSSQGPEASDPRPHDGVTRSAIGLERQSVINAGSRLQLLPLKNIHVASSFWTPKLDVYRTQTIPHSWQYMQWELRALRQAAGEAVEGELNGTWGEANLHKFLETCSYSLAQHPDPQLVQQVDEVIQLLGRAQQPDGYLHAYITNNHKPQWDPEFLDGSHDGYVLGHLIEAAIEYDQATGKDQLLAVARRAADQAYDHFLGPRGVPGFCGHAELEMALCELYRVTGEARYLELARAFVQWRGQGKVKPCSETPRAYFQDQQPLEQQKTLEGHAVRAVFFATGVADLALETGDLHYRLAAHRFWNSTARRRMTITGSIGPRQEHEAIGEDYELPQDGYYESCAACGLADFAQRMFLLERRSEYADVLERVLYNAVLHGLALDGRSSYYQNPLSDHDRPRYNSWVCCPPNLSRTLMQIGRYALASNEASIYVNLFVGGTYMVPVADKTVPLSIETEYPYSGQVKLTFTGTTPGDISLHLRIPSWCRQASVRCNDESSVAAAADDSGYLVLARRWQPGDRVQLELDMPPVWMEAHPNMQSCRGQIALQRGPLVYAFEGIDNADRLDFELGSSPPVEVSSQPDLLGGIELLATQSVDGRRLQAIPFYALANRRNSRQEVWRLQRGFTPSGSWWLGELYRPAP